jgi:hypothetical protein
MKEEIKFLLETNVPSEKSFDFKPLYAISERISGRLIISDLGNESN